jgi:hypothetical protein
MNPQENAVVQNSIDAMIERAVSHQPDAASLLVQRYYADDGRPGEIADPAFDDDVDPRAKLTTLTPRSTAAISYGGAAVA